MAGGRAVAVTGGQDGTVRAWDAAAGVRSVLRCLPVPAGSVGSRSAEVDGHPVAVSAAADGTFHTRPIPL